MNFNQCKAQSADGYLSSCNQVHETLPCEGGTLRAGVFFDGTGNQMTEPELYSNVARLARIYQIDREGRAVRWLYARGVGTNKGVTRDALGNAFGLGGQDRISGALHCLQRLVAEFNETNQSFPAKIVLDVFGFSRGAALARHFVNVIKQGAFNLDAEYQRIPKEVFRIGFLGVFDTVGSFGMPGNNSDPGYAFQIAPHWLEAGGLHLVADDEHRDNFSLQTILPGQDSAHPRDMEDGSLKEVVLPGAHSDVGGGYPASATQGQSNNALGRVALEKMYLEAQSRAVPLSMNNAPKGAEDERARFWGSDATMKSAMTGLMDGYWSYPRLRELHRRWRVLGVAEEKLGIVIRARERELEYGDRLSGGPRERELERNREKVEQILSRRSELETDMESCFARRRDYDEFVKVSNAFYAGWVHRSHNPHNRTIGMAAGLYGIEGRRAVFYAGVKSLCRDGASRRAAPRAFNDGAWIDDECLKENGQ